ncbi:hypothetical protein DF156_15570 [Burkholderia ubonensis]|nr:hypothetical protein DF155_14260 [Burkholderia ubonensis]RQP37358.1 hypothetical protein DF154_19610 [Burkholderia ubonensis]RQP40965.1 hypothetical protein DF156_15570 [Burkholderia ubonensis]RQP52750.1 hypothetical protein DF159_29490 [Burkholderia ubonensis]RQP54360.1 hypothetical protein DF144_15465 [Burkholderia ubonensis]
MRTKTSRIKSTNRAHPTLKLILADAMDLGLMQVIGVLTPRQYVDTRTMSSFELGLKFKQLLRDEMYERRRGATKRQQNGVAGAWPVSGRCKS